MGNSMLQERHKFCAFWGVMVVRVLCGAETFTGLWFCCDEEKVFERKLIKILFVFMKNMASFFKSISRYNHVGMMHTSTFFMKVTCADQARMYLREDEPYFI